MIARSRCAALGLLLVASIVCVPVIGQSIGAPAPPWLQRAAELSLGLNGVSASHGLGRSDNFFLVLSGVRSCDDDSALWTEFRNAVTDVSVLGGWCWTRVVPTASRPKGARHFLLWEFQIQPPLPDDRPLPMLAEVARGLDGVIDAEVWSRTGAYSRVLAMYRAGPCPDAAAEDVLLQTLMTTARDTKKLTVEAHKWTCDRNLVGPLFADGPTPAGPKFVHMRQVAKKLN